MSSASIDQITFNDFSLVTVEEKIRWKNALSMHLLSVMRSPSGDLLPDWKVEEQIRPMTLTIQTIVDENANISAFDIEKLIVNEGTGNDLYDATCK